jgi:hypothetical protein
MKEYSLDGQILQETKSETKSKLQQSLNYNKVVTIAESSFNANYKGFQPWWPDKEGRN